MDVYLLFAVWPSGETDVLDVFEHLATAEHYAQRWTRMHPDGHTVIRRFTVLQ